MPVIAMDYRNYTQMTAMAEWLEQRAGGTPRTSAGGGWVSSTWRITRMTRWRSNELGDIVPTYTRVEIRDPHLATLFTLRWA
jgi:hypothetical protein